jgi:hypothetical protein
MDPRCATAIRAAAAGRQISDERLKLIETTIEAKMRELARQDRRAWAALSRDERVSRASAAVMADIQAEAALKEHRAGLQVLRAAEREVEIRDAMKANKLSRSQGLVRSIEQTHKFGSAVRDEALSGLDALISAAESKDGTGVVKRAMMALFDHDNPAMTADIVREVFRKADGSTGNSAAKQAAQAWLDTIEAMRVRFNAAGGNIGKLGYGYLSQAHDTWRVREAGPARWADTVLPLLDREQYVRADGTLMNEAELRQVLNGAHETIASDGANKTEPGAFKGTGARSNRGSDHRVLHFKDGDAWMAYMEAFGEGSLYDAMLGHIGKMARDVALVERHGPNPEQWFRVQSDTAERADGVGTMANRAAGNTPQAYWDIATGVVGTPENRTVGRIGQDARNIQTAAKLGGAVLSSITDVGTIATTLHYNRLPYFDMVANVGRQFSKDQRQFLRSHGVIAESLSNTLNRWTGDNMTHSLTGRVAASVMKLSLMNAWTDGLRAAFSATMMQNFAKKLGKGWGELDEWDRYLMQRHDISEADWQTITSSKATERDGLAYLTRQGVIETGADNAQSAATKWLAFVSDEAQFAVVNPDLATRAIATAGGLPAGTLKGEAMRSIAQFKSFPIAMMTRHWRRIFETPQGLEGAPTGFGAESAAGARVNQIAGLAALNVSLMLLGSVVLQIKALVQGKDPYDMTEAKFWARAEAQGGGLGYLGDLLFKDPTEQHGGNVEQGVGAILGPAAGAAAGFAGDLLFVNAWELAKGKETHAGAEALKWVNSQLPFTGIWYVKGAWERAVLHDMQEAANPGYLGRVQKRAMKDWGQGYWWPTGEMAPERAPDFGRMAGQ